MVLDEAELDVERAAHRQEEVEVDEGADQREEDLLHRVAAEDSRERRAGDDRREHQQHHERAEVRRQDAVQRDGGGVAGEDLDPAHVARVGVAQDRVPAERRQGRLHRLQHDRGHQLGDRDARDRVPDLLEPAADVPAEQVCDRADHDDDERADHPPLPAEALRRRGRGRRRGAAHRQNHKPAVGYTRASPPSPHRHRLDVDRSDASGLAYLPVTGSERSLGG